MFIKIFKKGSDRSFQKGFTLYELLISISVVLIIMGIVLYNHSKFNTDLEITNVAYRAALSIRQAQISSISVRQYDSGRFDVPYGVHFNKDANDYFFLFADEDGNGIYTLPDDGESAICEAGRDLECVQKVSIGRGNTIKGFCGISWSADPNEPQPCSFSGDSDFGLLDVVFKRPNPDAIFAVYKDPDQPDDNNICKQSKGGSSIDAPCDGWAVCLISPQGREKRVVVYNTGQIAVENVEAGTGGACFVNQ